MIRSYTSQNAIFTSLSKENVNLTTPFFKKRKSLSNILYLIVTAYECCSHWINWWNYVTDVDFIAWLSTETLDDIMYVLH